jgi:hypothetical protein
VCIQCKVGVKLGNFFRGKWTQRLQYLNMRKPVGSIVRQRVVQIVRTELLLCIVLCVMRHKIGIMELLPVNPICVEVFNVVVGIGEGFGNAIKPT